MCGHQYPIGIFMATEKEENPAGIKPIHIAGIAAVGVGLGIAYLALKGAGDGNGNGGGGGASKVVLATTNGRVREGTQVEVYGSAFYQGKPMTGARIHFIIYNRNFIGPSGAIADPIGGIIIGDLGGFTPSDDAVVDSKGNYNALITLNKGTGTFMIQAVSVTSAVHPEIKSNIINIVVEPIPGGGIPKGYGRVSAFLRNARTQQLIVGGVVTVSDPATGNELWRFYANAQGYFTYNVPAGKEYIHAFWARGFDWLTYSWSLQPDEVSDYGAIALTPTPMFEYDFPGLISDVYVDFSVNFQQKRYVEAIAFASPSPAEYPRHEHYNPPMGWERRDHEHTYMVIYGLNQGNDPYKPFLWQMTIQAHKAVGFDTLIYDWSEKVSEQNPLKPGKECYGLLCIPLCDDWNSADKSQPWATFDFDRGRVEKPGNQPETFKGRWKLPTKIKVAFG